MVLTQQASDQISMPLFRGNAYPLQELVLLDGRQLEVFVIGLSLTNHRIVSDQDLFLHFFFGQ